MRSLTYEDFVVVGPVQPEGALGALFGDPAGGPWALVVSDDGGGSIGTLNGWSLTITTMTGVPPSEAPAVFTAAGGPVDIPDGDSDDAYLYFGAEATTSGAEVTTTTGSG